MNYSEIGKLGAAKTKIFWQRQKAGNIAQYNQSPQKCKHCNTALPYDKRRNTFCSSSCSASTNNIGVTRNGSSHFCLRCGEKTPNPKFCSSGCCGQYAREIIFQKIRSGTYKSSWSGNHILRDFLIKERGKECEECHHKKWLGKNIPLSVHHVDGDASNNKPNNLKLLCLNCHGLTNNFGSKNKNGTRSYRYK